ncbi:serine/threonine-protein kinase pim-2-like [Corythoichthys intestinalis]|uniref:serine/threonine-protein kinase pim-2-like n=1 Tax=Corythoichthys intestinalis TaxID=161448 RepID=UPI0025A53289|nr:serine/threonine-protein kinase pim-2-like [Corythoichthys intestinalis]
MSFICTDEEDNNKSTRQKTNPDKTRSLKAGRVFLCEPSHSSKTDVQVMRTKRKVEDDDSVPARKKLKSCEIIEVDKVSSSTSGDNESLLCPEVDAEPHFQAKDGEENDDGASGVCWAQLELKYVQERLLAEGGCGSVFAGYRKVDNFPVAIKHIPKDNSLSLQKNKDRINISSEVAVMKRLAKHKPEGRSPYVTLLDWYDLGRKIILVMERPIPAMDLTEYLCKKGGRLEESEAKVIMKQLVDVALKLQEQRIFHRDIKTENILIERTPDGLHVRIIDFGLSCFTKKRSLYRLFFGTPTLEPPEWLRHQSYRAGPTTAWQIGTVLFEILHDDVEFQTEGFLKEEIKICSKLSNGCRDFLKKSLTAEPEERPTLKELRHHRWLSEPRKGHHERRDEGHQNVSFKYSFNNQLKQ